MNKMKDTLMMTVMAIAFLTLTVACQGRREDLHANNFGDNPSDKGDTNQHRRSHISNEVQETKEFQKPRAGRRARHNGRS